MEDSPLYSRVTGKMRQTPSEQLPPLRRIPSRMTKDRLYKWIDCRIQLNSDLSKDIVKSDVGNDALLQRFHDKDGVLSNVLGDPAVGSVGELLKKDFCNSESSLYGNAYFVFGIPRVSKLNPEFYKWFDEIQDSENYDKDDPADNTNVKSVD